MYVVHLQLSTRSERVRTVTTKYGKPAEKIETTVFDDTSEAAFTLWGRATSSASTWQASQTILLLTNPGIRDQSRVTIALDTRTHVDVNPCMSDADWLRDFAQRLIKRDHVNLPFPENGTITATHTMLRY